MLQQTQVDRVASRFGPFLERFPTPRDLAAASPAEVLEAWSGLGYNRRALNLRAAARRIVDEHGGSVPSTEAALAALPGLGQATAAAVAAFAFGRPTVFLETNIRTALIHHFFPGGERIRDAELLPLAAAALGRRDPRLWYSALMDYGASLKRRVGNLSRRSAGHVPQAPFEVSRRQVRGGVLKALVAGGPATAAALAAALGRDREVVEEVLEAMAREGFVGRRGRRWALARD
jgi:A/G-specific adenine glycosylase